LISSGGLAKAKVSQEGRECIFTWSKKDTVSMKRCLIRQRSDMQTAKRHVNTASAVMISYLIRAIGRCDIDLNHHEIRLVIKVKPFHMLILNRDLIIGSEI
jgi:hypothetical protein